MAESYSSVAIDLPDEAATIALAQRLAPALRDGGVLYLRGDLGAGKTTFARALLQTLGAGERIKSPTYSLLERYCLQDGRDAFHLDLYRIAESGELEWLGLDELRDLQALVLVEWPERGGGDALPPADLDVALKHANDGRHAYLQAVSERAAKWVFANNELNSR